MHQGTAVQPRNDWFVRALFEPASKTKWTKLVLGTTKNNKTGWIDHKIPGVHVQIKAVFGLNATLSGSRNRTGVWGLYGPTHRAVGGGIELTRPARGDFRRAKSGGSAVRDACVSGDVHASEIFQKKIKGLFDNTQRKIYNRINHNYTWESSIYCVLIDPSVPLDLAIHPST
jgi:hypothetical protein